MIKIKYTMSIVAFIAAIIIGFIALFIPPKGIIDASVLWFTALLLVFVSGILGFSLKYDLFNHTAEHFEHHRRGNDDIEVR